MELRQLRYLVAVAKEKSLSKAAQKVHIAQPALGRQIQLLESELEVELLNRSTRGVELTAAGHRLFQIAERILAEIATIKPALQGLEGVPAGDVSIGVSPSLIPGLGKELVVTCAERYPLLKLHLVEGLSMFLATWLEQSRLDLAVYTALPDSVDTNQDEVAPEEVVVVGAPHLLHHWRDSIPAAELVSLPLLLTPAFRARLRSRLEREGIARHEAREIDSVSVVKEIVLQGEYCSILPYSFVQEDAIAGRLTALHFRGEPMLRRVVVATRTHSAPTLAVQCVSDLVREILRRLPTLRS